MAEFDTHAVLSTCTGKLMGDIDGVYAVTSFLLGRSAYTHELAFYGDRVAEALRYCHPELPSRADFEHVGRNNFADVRAEWEGKLGKTFVLDDALADVLADDKDAIATLKEMKPDAAIIPVAVPKK